MNVLAKPATWTCWRLNHQIDFWLKNVRITSKNLARLASMLAKTYPN